MGSKLQYSMLSEAHNAKLITFWLNEWTRLGAETPNEFVCDMSLALLNAGVRALAKLLKSNEANEMNYKETWSKKTKTNTKKSKYLKPDPMWTAKMNIEYLHEKYTQYPFNEKWKSSEYCL